MESIPPETHPTTGSSLRMRSLKDSESKSYKPSVGVSPAGSYPFIPRTLYGHGFVRDEEMATLRRQKSRLQKEQDLLRKATTFFAKDPE